ncbi:MAG: PIG-L family deacetylase [Fimbriimonadaceae bacterium]|nr:PIG-L family deacetylase [Fimbriimonadaceae bacterium]
MEQQPCLVTVGAHAADQEFTAGATLLKHVQAGWRAHTVNLSLGEKGHRTLSAADYAAQKRDEAIACANALGATPHFLPYRDGELAANEAIVIELATLLRRLQPTVVITHWRHSMHADHEACHQITKAAVFRAAIRHFDLDGLPAKYARLYYSENWEDTEGFVPYWYVDVTAQMQPWEAAFKSFAIGRGEGGYPYWDWYHARTRQHGIKLGVQHAQAFAVEPRDMWVRRELL